MLLRLPLFCLLLFPLLGEAQVMPTFGNSRTGGSGMQFLKIANDARSTAMAGSVVGIANDVSALYWNPAGITQTDTAKVNFMLGHTRYYAQASSNFAGAVFKPGRLSYLGVQVQSLNYATMEETTEWQPEGTGRNIQVSNVLVGLTYARILTDNFSFGVSSKWAHESIADVQVNNVLFDLGLNYYIGLMHSRFGVTFSNFGVNVSPEGSVTLLLTSGPKTVNSFSELSAPAIFRIGGAFDPVHKGLHVLTVSAQLNHPTDNNESFAVGTEYRFKEMLFARSGYEFGSDEPYSFPTMGVGYALRRRFGNIRIDYGFSNKSRLGNLHRLTLGFSIR